MADYTILYSDLTRELERKVCTYVVERGYKTAGGVAFDGGKYHQAVVKYDDADQAEALTRIDENIKAIRTHVERGDSPFRAWQG